MQADATPRGEEPEASDAKPRFDPVISTRHFSVMMCDYVATVLMSEGAKYLPLRILPPPYQLPSLTEAVQWHSLFTEDGGNRWLRTLFKQAASECARVAESC